MLQPQPDGLLFDCGVTGPGSFRIFAPAEHVTRGHRGDVRRLYEVTPPDGWTHGAQPAEIADFLPDSLTLTWRVENNSPLQVTISGYDEAARTARFAVRSEVNPSSARADFRELHGTCTVQPRAGAAG